MPTPITRDELRRRIDRDEPLVLLEALPAAHYEDVHLPGALNMPHDRVEELAPRLAPNRDAEVVVYCASAPCQNSGIAANRLVALGYTDVREYVEGKEDWIGAGLPVERGAMAATA